MKDADGHWWNLNQSLVFGVWTISRRRQQGIGRKRTVRSTALATRKTRPAIFFFFIFFFSLFRLRSRELRISVISAAASHDAFDMRPGPGSFTRSPGKTRANPSKCYSGRNQIRRGGFSGGQAVVVSQSSRTHRAARECRPASHSRHGANGSMCNGRLLENQSRIEW